MWTLLQNSFNDQNAISRKFVEIRERNEAALVAYLTANDPTPEAFEANCIALAEGGADIVEIGIPFSDPIADGPIIQASSGRALSNGATLSGILDRIIGLSSRIQRPIVVLTYFNPVFSMGPESFLERAKASSVSGVVIPDLPFEEGKEFGKLALRHSVDRVLLAAPNTTRERMRDIVNYSQGFLYLVSLYGVTGPRDALSPEALETLKRVKSQVNGRIPICAGFGISSPEQVSKLVSSGADGVIVGSKLVSIVSQHLSQPEEARSHLKAAVSSLKHATRKSASST